MWEFCGYPLFSQSFGRFAPKLGEIRSTLEIRWNYSILCSVRFTMLTTLTEKFPLKTGDKLFQKYYCNTVIGLWQFCQRGFSRHRSYTYMFSIGHNPLILTNQTHWPANHHSYLLRVKHNHYGANWYTHNSI